MKRHSVWPSVCASMGTHCMFVTVGWQAGDIDQLLQQWGVVGECIRIQLSSQDTCVTATGTHVPYEITQCYLTPGRGDIPALTPAEDGTRLSDPRGMQG